MAPRKLLSESVSKLQPYKPGKPIEEVEREFDLPSGSSIKLASNENPLGPSPKAMAAAREAMAKVHLYPDGGAFYLRKRLSDHVGLPMEQIILGNGSTELIELLAKAFLQPGDNAVISEGAFVMYKVAVATMDRKAKMVPQTDYTHDLVAMVKAVDENTKLVYVANPNNPTGTFNKAGEVERFLKDVPEDVVVVLDEAYHEYAATDPDYDTDTARYLKGGNSRRLILLRTFSKAYGLAGIRIGYGMSTVEIISSLNRVRSPFNANSVGQAAALAALDDPGHVEKSRKNNGEGRDDLYKILDALDLEYVRSSTNFILVLTPCDGQDVFKALLPRGVIVRGMKPWGFPKGIRVTIGSKAERDTFAKELGAVLKEISDKQ